MFTTFVAMKTILLLTDFSPNATAAAEAALLLAQKMRLDLVLFNSYMRHLELPASLGAGWDVEEFSTRHHHSKINMEALIEGLESMSRQDASAYQPTIHTALNDEDISISIEELQRRFQLAMIVMGAKAEGDTGYIHEANINSVIDTAKRPVLIIPANVNLLQLRKIIFATNFSEADIQALHFLARLGHKLNYLIDVVHIKNKKDGDAADDRQSFERQLKKMEYTGLTYKVISATDIPARLKKLCEKENALLALVHLHQSIFSRLFIPGTTKKETNNQTFPLIIFSDQPLCYDN